ncbi:hypothetical protein K457DRAFT_25190 [Linnemannia elongata AG-77]|uniref:Uncharacterized protein n=1 Tax=Linnemannia elongata AG-77 TaxID=1314771 RepID=A0A197JFQ0_9FUNG|nr:hypothetical protein K457DRAFT_25190 [Linnemannia elongata AG-77]
MLAPTSNTTTPGSGSDAFIHSQSILSTRAPQETNYQIDDDSRASALVAASPQHITEDYAVSSTYTTDSPSRTPSTIRNPQVQQSEDSPSFMHPPAYSPALSSSYIPPPSPTPSQPNAYPLPEGTYSNNAFSSRDGTYQYQQRYQQQQYQQNMYQGPYQRTYQQRPYPEPIVLSYPVPQLVDTPTSTTKKAESSSTGSVTKSTNNGRRKMIIWVGNIIIVIIIGAIVAVVVSGNKSSDRSNGGNSSSNSNSGNGSSKSSTKPTSTSTSSARNPVSSVPVTVSSAPVAVPTPTGGSGSGGSGRKTPIPPTLPPQYNCPTTFCYDWNVDCEKNVCAEDSDYKTCVNSCNGDLSCGPQFMLAPTSNTTTPGNSSDALIHSQSIFSTRVPQETNYQIDDDSRASALVAASPQHITEDYAMSSTYTTDSPSRTPSTLRSPHVQPFEDSPSFMHPPVYSPALSSSYIPPPSPTPSQPNAYPLPEGTYSNNAFSSRDGTYQYQQRYQQQQYQQNMYQGPYQRTYQQRPYPEPIVLSYPVPQLVDTPTSATEKSESSSTGSVTKSTNNGRRKMIIWIGSIIILTIIGAIIAVVVSGNKNSDHNNGGNGSSNSNSGNGSSKSSTKPTSTSTSSARNPVSSVPVTVPTPTSSGGSGRITPIPPTLPPQYNCPTFFCHDWSDDCVNLVHL